MTVKELMDKLQQLDPNLTVITNADTGSGIQKVHFVGQMRMADLAPKASEPHKTVAFIE